MHTSRRLLALLPLPLLTFAGVVHGQAVSVPDAGVLRQQIEQQREFPVPPPVRREPAAAQAEIAPQSETVVTVKTFRFTGNTLLSAEQLEPALQGFSGRPIAFKDLLRAADAVAAVYREAGWLVSVSLPEQDVSEGTVTLQVSEARFGGTRFEGALSQRVSAAQIEGYFKARQEEGKPLSATALDRALLLADDLPGVSVAGTLAPGQADGEVMLALRSVDEPLLQGDVGLDNAGARSTGAVRLTTNLNLNSPIGWGESASLNLLKSEGMAYGRIGFIVPLGHDGLRLGVNASSMTYKVIEGGNGIGNAGIRGRSSSVGADLSYPLLRARNYNLYLSAGAENKRFFSRDVAQVSSDYDSKSWRVGLAGNKVDGLGGGGVNSASLQLLQGRLTSMQAHSQLGSIDRSYHKMSYFLARQQSVIANHSVKLSLTGQHADQVLDSSERFYIGGASSVRAYPASEQGGDRGQVFSAEWRWSVRPDVLLTAFADVGRVEQLAQPSMPGSVLRLRGHGLSASWQGPSGFSTQITWARRDGRNPRPTLQGTDSDGTLRLNRFWLSASLAF